MFVGPNTYSQGIWKTRAQQYDSGFSWNNLIVPLKYSSFDLRMFFTCWPAFRGRFYFGPLLRMAVRDAFAVHSVLGTCGSSAEMLGTGKDTVSTEMLDPFQ